ncbi:UNVERIFIED_CONTAM: hypothetical protein FKN15_062074 [Acipenser sinensis]
MTRARRGASGLREAERTVKRLQNCKHKHFGARKTKNMDANKSTSFCTKGSRQRINLEDSSEVGSEDYDTSDSDANLSLSDDDEEDVEPRTAQTVQTEENAATLQGETWTGRLTHARAAGWGQQSCEVGLPVMAVTRRGGEEGVCAFPLSEWLGGGRSWNCSPYKITLCCFLRSALLDALDAPTVLERERTSGRKEKQKERVGKHLGRPRVLYRRGNRRVGRRPEPYG